MCGIIGYVGARPALPLLINGLKKLEYRGYDSAGVGLISGDSRHLLLRRTKGKIRDLEELLNRQPLPAATIGLSHTRWATHGVPSRANAHPHSDCGARLVVVHNGIIENYESLKQELLLRGHRFQSQTDTEVVAHLIEGHYRREEEGGAGLCAAVQKAIRRLQGTFALGVICRDEPDKLIAVRIGSPLIIGVGKGENFIASDVPAVIDSTKKVIYLKDGEMAEITRERVRVLTFAGREVRPRIDAVTFNVEAVEKQGYAHFMLKEIHEQPEIIAQILRSRVKAGQVQLDGLKLGDGELKAVRHIYMVACGTAYHAGMVGKYFFERVASIPVSVDAASEFRYRDPLIDRHTLIIAISQSGETADTLAAVKAARVRGAKVVAVCNVVGSSLTRESDGVLYTHAGPEIGVASTKAYVAQMVVLYLLALKFSQFEEKISRKAREEIIRALSSVPDLLRAILKNRQAVARIAKANSHFGCFLFLGRNINYPLALEGALKLKEISYIPAEGYAAGEMKHGPIALIDEYRAVVCVAPQSAVYEKMISNMQEIRARKGKIIAIATQGDETIKHHAQHVIYVPATHELLTPLLVALPLQLIAYYIAVALGCDVDQPRNLAKSVTVE